MQRKSFIQVLSIAAVYIIGLSLIISMSVWKDISRTDIETLNLTGSTVNQAKEILQSEGYSKSDYSFITKDGVKPGTGWIVEKVEDSRDARIFIKSEELPTLESLQIVGLTWSAAEKIMNRVGYFRDMNCIVDSKGKSIVFGNLWTVEKIEESSGGSAPVVRLIKSEIESTDKDKDAASEKVSIDLDSLKGKSLLEVRKTLTEAGWGNDELTTHSEEGYLVIIYSNWTVKDVTEDSGKISLTVVRTPHGSNDDNSSNK